MRVKGSTTPPPTDFDKRMTTRAFFASNLLGLMLIQAAWVLVVPAFRGSDEIDHAYKAAAVALGDWSFHHRPSPGGWGEFVRAPTSMIEAATPICETYPYTSSDNCRPSGDSSSGTSEVASSAARYNPVYYAFVGRVGERFEGTAAVYGMRSASAFACAVLFAWSMVVARRYGSTIWPQVAIVLAASPVVTYSTAVVAPNGLELCAALLVWVSLLGMARASSSAALPALIIPATVGATALVTLRTLGPLWLVLIVATCGMLAKRQTLMYLLSSNHLRVAAGLTALCAGGAMFWSYSAGTNALAELDTKLGSPWGEVPEEVMLWFLQSIAAFPDRTEPAPGLVYVAVAVPWFVVGALAWHLGSPRYRLALVIIVGLSTLIPVAFMVHTYSSAGTLWQGRYTYPYAMGFLLICGAVLDRSDATRLRTIVFQRWSVVAVAFTSATALVIGQLGVLTDERASSPSVAAGQWTAPDAWVVAALSVVGVGSIAIALLRSDRGRSGTPLFAAVETMR